MAGFTLSPGVYVKELDLSQLVRGVGTTVGGIVGYSTKGNVDEPVLVTSPEHFVKEYGERVLGNHFHYSALAFLQRGNRLHCMRVHNGALYGGAEIMDADSPTINTAFVADISNPAIRVFHADGLFTLFGKDPGIWNNTIGVRVVNIDTANLEFDIEVYHTVEGTTSLVESFRVSRQRKVDGYGRQMHLEEKINGFSDFIRVRDNTTRADTLLPKEQDTTLIFAGGSDGVDITSAQVVAGWDKFSNPDNIDVRILINAGFTDIAVQSRMRVIAEARRDCVAVLDVPYAQLTNVGAMITWRTTIQNFNSAFCALYTPWVKDYDPRNDVIVELPPSGYVAAQFVFNDAAGEPWFAPMGFNRGLLNVLGLTNVFTQGERDALYEKQINPIQVFRGEGIPLWGQKVQLTRPSAIDRINVRRLLIIIEKSLSVFLKAFVGEPNTKLVRFRVRVSLEEFLDILAARGAFQIEVDKGYYVQCDETNNTPATIDRNELHVYVYVKPIRSVEFIRLGVIITPTGIRFEEMIARGIAL